MNTIRLIVLSLKYHWDAQRSNPTNLAAAVIGMVINNIIVMWGLWAMLFDGKPDGKQLTIYFLTLNSMLTIAWGSICFVSGGLHSLGQTIEEGALEPVLATPRRPLLLVALSNSIAPALGDVLQGLCSLVVLFFIASTGVFLRCIAFTFVCGIGVVALFVLTGSVPFFVKRGNALSNLLRECCLSFSFYPVGKVFTSTGRYLLLITPAAATGVLPMEAIETGTWHSALISLASALGFLWLSFRVFELGLRKYQSASYVVART